MLNELNKDQIGFLLLVDRLVRRKRELTSENILSMAQIKLPGVAENFQVLLESLEALDLFQIDTGRITLTQKGKDLVQQAGKEHSLVGMFYDEFYQTAGKSPAHSEFCRRVYGLDLGQHGMADLEQLGILIEEISLGSGQSFLDFGCGSGQITEYLAETIGAKATGIDKSPQAIRLAQERTAAKRDRLDFYWADIHKKRGELPEIKFNHVIAIDSLFFAPDESLVFQTLWERIIPGGTMGVFYIGSPDQAAQETPLGEILSEKELPYRVLDLSAQNKAHWAKKEKVLLEMEEEFRQEGSDFLFHNRLSECQGNMGDLKRFLYIIPKE